MTSEHLYDNGLPWTCGIHKPSGKDRLAYNLDMQQERVDMGLASMILIDGTIGKGKTTLDIHIMDYIEQKEVDFDDHLFMGGEVFIKGMKICFINGSKVATYDESGDFNKRGTLSKLNKILSRIFEIYRAFKLIVILSLPKMIVLDNDLFSKEIPRMLIHITKRTKKQADFNVYSLDRMLWIRERAKKCVIPEDAYKLVQPNFRGHFKNLPPLRSKILDKFSTKGKMEVVDLAQIKQEGLMDFDELAIKVGRTKDWVKRKVSKLNIRPDKIWKVKKYYGEGALNRLKQETK